MAKFRLTKKSENKVRVTFHILDQTGDVCSSVNMPPEDVPSFLQCWGGTTDHGERERESKVAASKVLMEAFAKQKPTRAMVLRGC
jgi:hypothetical protein